jgi:hypothetical protein
LSLSPRRKTARLCYLSSFAREAGAAWPAAQGLIHFT